MRHYDDDDDEQTRPPDKKMDPPSSSSPPAAAARKPQPRKVYSARKNPPAAKTSYFGAEEQTVEPAPAVQSKATTSSKPRRTTPQAQYPGAQHVRGHAYDDDDEVYEDDDDDPRRHDQRAEAIPTLPKRKAEGIPPPLCESEGLPFAVATAHCEKKPSIPVANVIKAEKVEEIDDDGKPVAGNNTGDDDDDDDDQNKHNNNDGNKKKWMITIIALIAVVIVVIIIVVVASGGGGGDDDNDSNNTEEEYIELIQSRSPFTYFDSASSPQRLTLDWMSQDSTTSKLNDERVIQRFAAGVVLTSFGYNIWSEQSNNECDWHGMACNHAKDQISRINFYNERIVGTVPHEIGLLTNVQWLDLSSNNGLSGWLPSDIQKMTNLNTLFLSDTSLTGSISNTLCQRSLNEAVIDCNGDISCNCCQCN